MSILYNKTTAGDHADNSMAAVLTLSPLLAGHPFIADQRWLDEFASNAIIPQGIEYQGGRRLGFYYQWLWQQLILHHPCYELLAEEIQLSVDKRTLGAVDFLVRDLRTNLVEHWKSPSSFILHLKTAGPAPTPATT